MHNYKSLNVWKDSVDFVTEIYKLVSKFPPEEKYALTSQIKRSAVSIPSNVAEGAGRNSDKEFHNFLGYSFASSCELDTQIIVARNVGFINTEEYNEVTENINHIQKRIFNLKKKFQ